MSTRLSIMMDDFGISGKDLSSLLHIDSSLVSKWRSGKRKMKPNSIYISQLINHIMALDRSNQYAKIRLMLSNEYVNIFKASENELSLFLKDWLTMSKESGEGKHDYFEEIKTFKNAELLTTYSMQGEDGRRQAFRFLQKYAQQLSPDAEIWIYTTESEKWASEPPEYFDEWTTRCMSLLAEGNTIKVIHNVPGPFESLAESILTWLPMHLTGKTTPLFIQRYKHEKLSQSFFVIKDEIALFNWAAEPEQKAMNTYITHEPAMVHDMQIIMSGFFKESGVIFQKYDFTSRDELLNNIAQIAEMANSEYQWGTSCPLCEMTPWLMREVLTENGIPEEHIDEMIVSITIIAEMAARSPRKLFIDIARLKQWLKQDYVVLGEMSFFCGCMISVSHSTFVKLVIDFIKNLDSTDKKQVCIATTPYLQRLGETEIVVKEDAELSLRRVSSEKEVFLTTREPTIVTAICRYFDDLWNTTPYIYRNKPYVARQMRKLIDECMAAEQGEKQK